MATAAHPISLDEFMRTSYSPDCEYVDGWVVERNAGLGKHAYTMAALFGLAKLTGAVVLPVQRIQVSQSRIRVPDVCVVEELEEIISKAPFLCVEVLSPDDRWNRVNASISDYQAMGVPCVWVIDPYSSRAWIFELDSPPVEVQDGKLTAQGLGIEIQLQDILP